MDVFIVGRRGYYVGGMDWPSAGDAFKQSICADHHEGPEEHEVSEVGIII